LLQSGFEDVERVGVEEIGRANVRDFVAVVELEVALAEVVAVAVLMPADGVAAVGDDPLDAIVVAGRVFGELELDFQPSGREFTVDAERDFRFDRGVNLLASELRRGVADTSKSAVTGQQA
jgi:hypothetical protein